MVFEEIFYISGIAVNISIIYTLYKFFHKNECCKYKCILNKGETGEIHNLHSSQSVGNVFKMAESCETLESHDSEKEQEKKIEERLRQNEVENQKWYSYLPYIVGKKLE